MAESDRFFGGDGTVIGLEPEMKPDEAHERAQCAGFMLAMRPHALQGADELGGFVVGISMPHS
jgi:hypothetical protein